MADEAGSFSDRKASSDWGGEEEVKVGAVQLSVGRKAEDTIRRGVKKEGYLQKRGYRFYNIFSCCLGPVWKDRYFVLSGGYLFRFTNESVRTVGARVLCNVPCHARPGVLTRSPVLSAAWHAGNATGPCSILRPRGGLRLLPWLGSTVATAYAHNIVTPFTTAGDL